VQKKQLALGKVLFNLRIFSLFLILSGSLLTYMFVLPLISDYLQIGYHISNDESALITTFGTFTYMVTMLMLPNLLKVVSNQVVLSFGLFMGAFSCAFIAPTHSVGLPYQWWTAAVGLLFAGVA
jgi:cyanate permease